MVALDTQFMNRGGQQPSAYYSWCLAWSLCLPETDAFTLCYDHRPDEHLGFSISKCKSGRLVAFSFIQENYGRAFVLLAYVYIQNPVIFIEEKHNSYFFKSQTD